MSNISAPQYYTDYWKKFSDDTKPFSFEIWQREMGNIRLKNLSIDEILDKYNEYRNDWWESHYPEINEA